MPSGLRPVNEATRIDILNLLQEFQQADEKGMWRQPSPLDSAATHSHALALPGLIRPPWPLSWSQSTPGLIAAGVACRIHISCGIGQSRKGGNPRTLPQVRLYQQKSRVCASARGHRLRSSATCCGVEVFLVEMPLFIWYRYAGMMQCGASQYTSQSR